jgi:NADPH:quinone reductase
MPCRGCPRADDGVITPLLDPRTFNLQSVHDAHLAVEDGSARGKVIVDMG